MSENGKMTEQEAGEFARQLTLELMKSGQFHKAQGGMVHGKAVPPNEVGKAQADFFIAFHDQLLEHFRPKPES